MLHDDVVPTPDQFTPAAPKWRPGVPEKRGRKQFKGFKCPCYKLLQPAAMIPDDTWAWPLGFSVAGGSPSSKFVKYFGSKHLLTSRRQRSLGQLYFISLIKHHTDSYSLFRINCTVLHGTWCFSSSTLGNLPHGAADMIHQANILHEEIR